MFKPGDIVWVKPKVFPWWPAKVIDVKEIPSRSKKKEKSVTCVQYLAENIIETVNKVDHLQKFICDSRFHFQKIGLRNRKYGDLFEKALSEVWKMLNCLQTDMEFDVQSFSSPSNLSEEYSLTKDNLIEESVFKGEDSITDISEPEVTCPKQTSTKKKKSKTKRASEVSSVKLSQETVLKGEYSVNKPVTDSPEPETNEITKQFSTKRNKRTAKGNAKSSLSSDIRAYNLSDESVLKGDHPINKPVTDLSEPKEVISMPANSRRNKSRTNGTPGSKQSCIKKKNASVDLRASRAKSDKTPSVTVGLKTNNNLEDLEKSSPNICNSKRKCSSRKRVSESNIPELSVKRTRCDQDLPNTDTDSQTGSSPCLQKTRSQTSTVQKVNKDIYKCEENPSNISDKIPNKKNVRNKKPIPRRKSKLSGQINMETDSNQISETGMRIKGDQIGSDLEMGTLPSDDSLLLTPDPDALKRNNNNTPDSSFTSVSYDPNLSKDTCTSDSDEEDLPEGLTPVKSDCQYSRGDIVWAQVKGWPFWPAVVTGVYKEKKKLTKLTVRFINDGTPDQKIKRYSFKMKSLHKTPVYLFTDSHREQFQKEGYASADRSLIEGAVKQAEDYFTKLGLGLLKTDAYNFFFPNSKDEICEVFSETEDDCGIGSDELEENILLIPSDEPISTESSPVDSLDESPESESMKLRNKKRRCRSEKLIEFIQSEEMKTYLKEIFTGRRTSSLHLSYHGTVTERNRIRNPGFGPINDEEQRTQILDTLVEWSREIPEFKVGNIDYVMDVWLPEAIVHALVTVKRYGRSKAWQMFRKGIRFTKEEIAASHKALLKAADRISPKDRENYRRKLQDKIRQALIVK